VLGWFGQARSQNPFTTGIRAVSPSRDTLCQTTKNHETTRDNTKNTYARSRVRFASFVSFVSFVVSWYESLQPKLELLASFICQLTLLKEQWDADVRR